MRLRLLGVFAVAALAVVGLSACQSNVGRAATVDGQSITETTVTGYLTANAKPLTNSSGGQIAARNVVLSTLIQQQIYDRALQSFGGAPTPTELGAARQQVLNGGTEDQLLAQVVAAGLDRSFEPLFLRTGSLAEVLQARATAGGTDQTNQILGTLAKVPVSVSPRYGSWDPTKRTLSGDPAQSVASFVNLAAAS